MSRWIFLIPILLLTGIAVWCDVRTREIPNRIPAIIFIWALAGWIFQFSSADAKLFFGGLVIGTSGGLILYFSGGFGGGDAKLLAALGGVLGIQGTLVMLTIMALAGGVLALVAAARGQRAFAYGPAIGAGVLGYFLLVIRGML